MDSINISSILSIYSDLYEKTGQADSVFSCYKKLLSVGNIYGKQGAYKGLTKYYLDRGKNEEAKKYLKLYMQITDSIKRINVSDAVARALSMYNYRIHEKENYELKIKNQQEKEQKKLLCFILLLIIVMSSSVVLWYRHKNRLMKLEKEKAELTEKNRILEEQRLRENKILQVKASDIYKIVTKKLADFHKKQEALTDKEWDELNNTINKIYIGFEGKVHNLIPGISRQEYRVCLLIKIGIRPTYIAILTNHSRAAINSTRSRLYEKAYSKKASPSEWDEIIRSL